MVGWAELTTPHLQPISDHLNSMKFSTIVFKPLLITMGIFVFLDYWVAIESFNLYSIAELKKGKLAFIEILGITAIFFTYINPFSYINKAIYSPNLEL